MIYVIGIAGIAFLLLFGTVKVQHANNVKLAAEKHEAVTANKTLADDCKKKIDFANGQLADIAKGDAVRAARAKAAKAKADAEKAKTDPKVQQLTGQAVAAPAATAEAQCAAATVTLQDVAKVRHP